MDYIAELNAFTDWLEINPLEPTTQTLWFHLMAIANKSGCPEWFTVANPLLQAKVGVTENTLNKHRNYLVQKGRIEYRSQGKQKAGKYKIIYFTSNNEVKQEVKHEVKRGVKGEVKGSVLFKDFNSSSASSTCEGVETGYESFYSAYNRVFGFDCNPFQAQQLADYIEQDGIEEAVVIRAIERAATASTGHNFKLILKIMDDYYKSGVRTLEQAKAIDAQYDARRMVKSSVPVGSRKSKLSFAEMARGMNDEA
ncbi:DnaD domain protein [Paenibacillus sp. 3LSP]|uniref:DnaD domain-containing protein n=1 Tax=Paenibacillus sp. 3LSP TaxID=2800795 RepID=UPI0028FD4D39|nr:DnaD domain protein [Paenibacillus sp. 3LSP]MDU0332557.1 DnaD domain protein [Paenibacillus sp. 3LSP]